MSLPRVDWVHLYCLTYNISVHGQQLQFSLSVFNSSDQTWDLNAALHTYLRGQEASKTALRGL